MSARILDGKALAAETRLTLRQRVDDLRTRGVVPRLDVIVASQDPASLAYVAMKRRFAAEIGIESEDHPVGPETTQAELHNLIERLNADPAIHGILMQHPLPPQLDELAALERLGATKDVDGISPQSMGRLLAGMAGFRAATPLGIMRLLERHGIEPRGLRALVVGRSFILGKPAALMLLERDATVTIAHSRSADLPGLCREADLVVAAVGRPEMFRGDWFKPGAIVVDAGYNRVKGRRHDVGDVRFEEAVQVASWITPVPGGVGPMTVATLLANVVDAASSSA
jgi:methylenetetrahydrofolate dehydrogenase (NADP+)/methenyltetrahydrofolate cyclohydrolase